MTLSEQWTSPETNALFEAVLSLEDVSEAERFFRDLCTLHELEELSTRWAVARLLAEGLPYRRIAEEARSSTATVTRINHWLRHGSGGYRLALDRLGIGSPGETV
jgi:TrpR-related protein YerC/YecD